ncbi:MULTISPECIES: acyl-CoA thioesterase [Halomonadaceae]|jgi:acyl-CoA thioesterase-2|uniref:Acyl-CoA thioesterase 2 n=1 Tax=Vreelandella titanicae TaxID=664683 RepID=A0A653WUJ6_9GAMM|nr:MULTISPECIES: acyl-CoA thioesterase II [Halomonas]UEQ03106.1 acyl-CoA thioesterase II [Halomonas profundus]KIN13045.1 acyl-CoA thioesterase [Halomonas sp. KHS3]MCD1586759.1 acyl-CoA thioesterase II [Halomonas sp. IOP_14]QKS25119.1 Acyl-CoA thioesterase 2 [Halomonas titanicae]QNU64658.1 acyl-CoA thioesterase II [Halomonas titanicae]
MTDALNKLVALLELETLEETLYRGQSQDLGFPQLYGGQVLGQALAAAARTVPIERRPHSQHGYFLRPGDPHRPVVYQVDTIRDGGSFTTRRVTAIQKGRPIFFCSASFQSAEASFSHQRTMPDVPTPEALIENGEAKHDRFPGHPIEFVHLPGNPDNGTPAGQCLWFRLSGTLPDDPALHRHLLSYASDFNLLTTSLIPHGIEYRDPKLRIASLDHALWLHQDTRLDDWLLYVIDSPWTGGARGLARGHIYSRDGRLVASTAQEGLTRYSQS